MRIITLICIFLVCIGLDMGSKYYFDHIAWEQYCHASSPYLVPDGLWDGRLIWSCSQDVRTGADFYDQVYKDSYSPILGAYLGFQLSYNSWVAFSLPVRWIFLQLVTLFLIGGLLYQYLRVDFSKKSKLLDIGYILILAWALSHAYERIFVGHVVDFIAVKYFAILNFADIFISIGVAFIILAYYAWYRHTHE